MNVNSRRAINPSSVEKAKLAGPDFSKQPQGMADKLSQMVNSGQTDSQLATSAVKKLARLAGRAADLRRQEASPAQIERYQNRVADVFQQIELEHPLPSPESFDESRVNRDLQAAYGKSVVKDPHQQIYPDEHAAVRTYYGKKNGLRPAEDNAARASDAGKPQPLDKNQREALKAFKTFVLDRWSRIDRNNDGELQFDEVHQLAKDDRYSGERLDYIATLLRRFGEFAAQSKKVGKERISIEKKTFEAMSGRSGTIGARVARDPFLKANAKVEDYAASRTDLDNVYGKELVPLNLRQGSVGDCWYISYLSGSSAEELKEVVQPHPTKNAAVVHLQGDRKRVIEAPSKVELQWSAKSDGYWGFALEEALNQRGRDSNPVLPGEHVLYDGLQSEAHAYINGGESVGLLTAENQTNEYWDNFLWKDRQLSTSVADCREFITNALAAGDRIFVGAEGANDAYTLENKVVGYHAYQVLSYDPDSDTFRLRNPWGEHDPRDGLKTSPHYDGVDDGVYTVEMPEFVATYDSVIRTRQKARP